MMWGLWTFTLVLNLLEPVALIYGGWKLIKDPPRSEKRYLSYNTSRARKSREAWDFAQEYCGKVWRGAGLLTAALAVLVQIMLPSFPNVEDAVWTWFGVLLTNMLVGAATVIVVEVKLRQNFDKDGNRR